MLKKLKKKIENNNFSDFINIAFRYDELIISADNFSGYSTIKEQAKISSMIDTNIYIAEYLNANVIKVKLK